MRASGCCWTIRSAASIPSICGMVISMSTMSGCVRSNSLMAVKPSPASAATCPPKVSIMRARFLRANTESSTIKERTGCPSLLRFTDANCSIQTSLSTAYHVRLVPHQITLVTGTCPILVSGAHCPAGRSYAGSRVPSTNGLQCRPHSIQPDYAHGVSSFDRRFGHAVDHARLFALRDGHAAFFFHRSQPLGAVIAHAGHQHSDRMRLEFFGRAAQEHIRAGTVPVHPWLVAKHYDISQRQPFHFHVAASRTDQHAAWL